MEDIKHIVESMLFVSDEPLTVDRIKRVLIEAESGEIRDALKELSAEYEARPGGFYLHEVAGGFQIRTRPEYSEWIRKLIQPKPLRLSKAAMETLAIIAYKQPVIRSDVEYIRGVDCGGVLRVLLERKLIRVLGYATTKRFLEVFDLKDLKDLPTPREIEELEGTAWEETAATLQENAGPEGVLVENLPDSEADLDTAEASAERPFDDEETQTRFDSLHDIDSSDEDLEKSTGPG